MSSAIDTTVDFRRKLLRFDRPLYPQYRKSSIPRFYSSFIPSWRSYFIGPQDCSSKPEHYPVEFPLRNIEIDRDACYNKSVITPTLFNVRWILLVILAMVFIASQKKLFVLLLIALVYYLFPSVEFFHPHLPYLGRPVRQRGGFFHAPSWHR